MFGRGGWSAVGERIRGWIGRRGVEARTSAAEDPEREALLWRGPAAWNEWRTRSPDVRPDLRRARFNRLPEPPRLFNEDGPYRRLFQQTDLSGVDLREADCRSARIQVVELRGADLRLADLRGADVRWSNLGGADLRGADLRGTQFVRVDFTGARLDGARLGGTHFGDCVLAAEGLETVRHDGPSRFDPLTIIHSLPLDASFASSAGIDEPSLVMARRYSSLPDGHRPRHCFISYSRRDEEIVSILREVLLRAGVPVWFAPTDLRVAATTGTEAEVESKLGRDLHAHIDRAECFLLVVSRSVLSSDWIAREVRRARSKVGRRVAVLVDDMPEPGGARWAALLASGSQPDETDRFYDRDPAELGAEVGRLLTGGPIVDLRGATIAEHVATHLPDLLALIGEQPGRP